MPASSTQASGICCYTHDLSRLRVRLFCCDGYNTCYEETSFTKRLLGVHHIYNKKQCVLAEKIAGEARSVLFEVVGVFG